MRRVKTESGSVVDPPLEEWWPDLRKLQWHAEAVALDAGLPPERVTAYEIEDSDGLFGLTIGRVSCSGMPYGHAWRVLNGVRLGAQLALEMEGGL